MLINEILDASNKIGNSIKKKEEVHRMAESNRAFSIITAPFMPELSAIRRKGAKTDFETIIAPINSSSFKFVLAHVLRFLDK